MIKLVVCTCLLILMRQENALCQNYFDQNNKACYLSNADIDYVYNRAFDIALRDGKSGLAGKSMFFVPFESIDNILITISPVLSRKAFYLDNLDSLNWIKFQDSLDVEEQFKDIKIRNTFNIQYQHYFKTPILEENHLIHTTFSDIYMYEDYFYMGVLLEHQMESSAKINYPNWVIFKFEKCNNKYILFRKMYHPVGGDGIRNYSYTRDLDDRRCY